VKDNNTPLRVFIIDDYAVVREGLVAILNEQPDMLIVGTAAQASEALATVRLMCPDVILLDMALPNTNGLELVGLLKQACPDSHILVLTSFTDDAWIGAVLEAGANGYIPKDAGRDHLLTMLRVFAILHHV